MIRFRNLLFLSAVLLLATCLLAANPTTRSTARDLQNQPHDIPTAGRPTVLVFLHPGQKESDLAVSEVAQDLAKAKQLSILGIISGPADAAVRPAVDAIHWNWPLLTDPAYSLSGDFQVNAWPTTIIFDSQGNPVGRIAGRPYNLKASLAAYVAYVSGTLTRAQLDEELTRLQIVQDDADQKAHRHLLLVKQFLTSGRVEDAAAQMQQAQDLAPAAEALRLLMARELLLLGETTQADAVLATIEGTSQSGELALLRGRSAIAAGRWQEAKNLLLKPQTSFPDPTSQAETQYLLGVIHTHNNDYLQAAQAFRKAYETTLPNHGISSSSQKTLTSNIRAPF